MKILWTEPACSQLDGIYSYIAQSSEQYAKRIIDRITSKTIQVGDHPLSGRKVPEYDHEQIREVIERPYRIIYHVLPDRIEVLAIIHGAQDFK